MGNKHFEQLWKYLIKVKSTFIPETVIFVISEAQQNTVMITKVPYYIAVEAEIKR